MRFLSFFTLTFLLISCLSSKKSNPITFEPVELRDLDTLTVNAAKPSTLKVAEDYVLPVYQASNEGKLIYYIPYFISLLTGKMKKL